MSTYAVCILAGGEATRLPGKLTRPVDGVALILRVYSNVSGSYPVYVCAKETFAPEIDRELQCPVIIDRWHARGPLGGLLTAFGVIEADRIFAVPGDAPNVERTVLETLRAAWQPGDRAVVAAGVGGLQPLVALYDRRAFLEAAWPIFSESASVQAVARALNARTVPLERSVLKNLNTPADFEVTL